MKLNHFQRLCFVGLFLVLSCAACGDKSATEAPQVPAPTEGSAEESAISPTTPAEPTIVPPTEVAPTDIPPTEEPVEEAAIPFDVVSEDFAQEEPIPVQFTCDGANISPALQWADPPEGTQSFALISDDPDAPGGTWVHWVLYNIPTEARELPEAIPAQAELEDGSLHGVNDFGRLDYGGPCPPGGTHRYFFKLYALDVLLDLESGVDKAGLLEAMEGHVLAEAELMGTYSR